MAPVVTDKDPPLRSKLPDPKKIPFVAVMLTFKAEDEEVICAFNQTPL